MIDAIVTGFSDSFTAVPWPVALTRILLALFLGAAIGWEREMATKPAGLRTHVMVTVASCLFTLLTFELMEIRITSPEHLRTDPIRLIEAVTAGVAFLAAGSIIGHGDKVRGLTTAAGLWLGGAIGVACGLGKLALAVMATAVTLVVLWLMRRLLESTERGRDPND